MVFLTSFYLAMLQGLCSRLFYPHPIHVFELCRLPVVASVFRIIHPVCWRRRFPEMNTCTVHHSVSMDGEENEVEEILRSVEKESR